MYAVTSNQANDPSLTLEPVKLRYIRDSDEIELPIEAGGEEYQVVPDKRSQLEL